MKSGLLFAALFAAMFAALPSGWAACTGPSALQAQVQAHPGAQAYTELGTWFGRQRQHACAAEAFQSALKFEPHSARLFYLLGMSLYFSGQAQEGVDALRLSIQTDPTVIGPRLSLAAALDQLDRPADAQAEWRAALRLEPHSRIALDGLAKSLTAAGNYAETINLLRPLAVRDEDLTLDLALAYGKADLLDDAGDVLAQAMRKDPSSLRLTNATITVLVHKTHYEDAALLAKKAVDLHPGNPEAQRMYLRILVLNGDMTVAPSLGRKLLAANPHDSELLYLNGIIERKAGDYTAARAHLEQSVALDPKNASARANLGSVLAKLQDPSDARVQLEKAIELGAQEPQIHYDLANVLRTLGETKLAQEQLTLYQQALQTEARAKLASSKGAQADQELATGDPKKAAALYREAIEADPKDALMNFKLGTALDRAGDTAGERAALQQAVRIDPTLAVAQNQLGYLASQSGDSAVAERHFRLAVRAAPEFTQAWVSLAATLGQESRFPEAKEAVASALRLEPHNAEALELSHALNAAQARH